MPSITDVYNQLVTANSTLSQLHADVLAGTNATNQVNASVGQLDNDVNKGFNVVETQLTAIAQIEVQAVGLLFHLTQQTDTMICVLDQISRNTCEILNQATIQTELQRRIRDDSDVMREIAEFAHPEAALQRERLAALRAEVERCCPVEVPPPACHFESCKRPDPVKEPRLPRIPTVERPQEPR